MKERQILISFSHLQLSEIIKRVIERYQSKRCKFFIENYINNINSEIYFYRIITINHSINLKWLYLNEKNDKWWF